MEVVKLLLAFAPWFAFWFISGPSMLRLKIAILVAAALIIVMAVTKLHRGAILWAGYAFFSFALISVVWLENVWVIYHLGILASGTLFMTTQLSMLVGHPFTESYAREHVPKELWNSSSFLRSCFITTSAWSFVFLANTMVNAVRLYCPGPSEWLFTAVEYLIVVLGIIFTSCYSRHARQKRMEDLKAINDGVSLHQREGPCKPVCAENFMFKSEIRARIAEVNPRILAMGSQ